MNFSASLSLLGATKMAKHAGSDILAALIRVKKGTGLALLPSHPVIGGATAG